MTTFQLAASLLLTAASVNGAGIGNFFTYFEDGGLGPSRWQFLEIDNNQCGGTNGASTFGQSPVEISEATQDGTCDTDMGAYKFFPGNCKWTDLDFTISNNGVKVAPKSGVTCSFGQMNIPHTPNKFNALQYHIHTYSEHRIVGQGDNGYFPAELHVVHQEETAESFAVFGTMMMVGPEPHPMFEWFLQGWEATATATAASCPNQDSTVTPVQDKVQCGDINVFPTPRTAVPYPDEAPNLYDLPTEADWGTFTYKGGLTTPACTEIVNWNLLDKAMAISQEQLDRLERLILCFADKDENDQCGYATVADKAGSTSRPPQALLGRKVLHRCSNGPSITIDDIGVLPPSDEPFGKPPRESEPANTGSSKCTKTIYESCSDDKRYNPRVSPNLKSNAASWYDAEGYWVGKMQAYNNEGAPLMEVFASERFKNTLPYPRDNYMVFLNRTVKETRYYEHAYFVYRPSDPTTSNFCSAAVPEESANVIGTGTCGVNGYVETGEKFGTATHEKDGTVEFFMATGRFSGADKGEFIPIDMNTFYATIGAAGFEYSETESFSNANHTRISGSGQYFIKSDFPPYSINPLAESYVFEVDQVRKEDFIAQLDKAYFDNNIVSADRKPIITSGNCIDPKMCPSEEDFRKHDPLHTDTPYDEDVAVKGGWIAFFVLIGVGLLLCCLCYLHHRRVSQQADRYKHQFAKRIAATIELEGTHEKLTPDALEDEFKRMDKDQDGVLTKQELKDFMGERMNDRDFEAMFAAIDLDHNGTIDFSEFCSFLAQIGAIYDEEEVKVDHVKKPASEPAEPAAEPEPAAEAEEKTPGDESAGLS